VWYVVLAICSNPLSLRDYYMTGKVNAHFGHYLGMRAH
jgi:hypothetical protein